MLLNNNIVIESILHQRYPMLMLDRVIDISEGKIDVKPKLEGFYAEKEYAFYRWMMLESMGQAAELLWRLKGVEGKGYLTSVEDYINFPSKLELHAYDFHIIAEEKNTFNHFYQSIIRFIYNDNQFASVRVTHYFK